MLCRTEPACPGVSVPRESPGTYPCRPSRRQPLLPGHQLKGAFYEVFRAVVDYRCTARLESDLRFLRSRYCSNHVNPKRSCPLCEDLTHSTSCSVVQDAISFVELNGFLQQVTCCQSLEQAAGCLVVCYSIGNYGEAILRIETHRRVR